MADFGRLISKNACSIHCRRREKDCLSKVYLNPLKLGVFKGYDQTNMQQTRKRRGITFLELRGAPSFWKMTPPESHGLYWGLKHSENGRNFFHASHIQKLHFAKKKWSKTTNPSLSSSLKKTLPRIWGHHHQLDDQHKEAMIQRSSRWAIN